MNAGETMRRIRLPLLLVAFIGAALAYSNAKDPAPKNGVVAPTGETQEDLKKRLSPIQYRVTQQDGTEPPFKNDFWDSKKEGIYVDIVSGEPLFSSTHKYKSGTGWPSFYQPIDKENVLEKEDHKLFRARIEVRSKTGNSHLGHLFKDGPAPTGLRYCINSASLRFVPAEDLKKAGLDKYSELFKKAEAATEKAAPPSK